MNIVALSSYGIISITGPDPEKFLQGQITCDVREIDNQHFRLGAYCDHKGRVSAIFYLFRQHDQFLMLLPKDILATTVTTLSKYGMFSKIVIKDVSQDYQIYGFIGNDLLTKHFSKFPQHVFDVITENNNFIAKIPSASANRYILFGNNNFTANDDEESWQRQSILANMPMIHNQTAGLFTPHMLNLPELKAVSFNKGCYLGQEIIVRTEHLGKVKRQLQQVAVDEILKPGEKFQDGIVVNAVSDLALIVK